MEALHRRSGVVLSDTPGMHGLTVLDVRISDDQIREPDIHSRDATVGNDVAEGNHVLASANRYRAGNSLL